MEDGEKVNTFDCGDVGNRQRLSTIPNIIENIPSTSTDGATSYNNISDDINEYDINQINYLNPIDESQLRSWQENQLRTCIFENRINDLLEVCYTNFNVDIDRDNIQNRTNGLEESAILMAINEHGLQDAQDLEHYSISSSSSSSSLDFSEEFIDSRLYPNLTAIHSVSAPTLSTPLPPPQPIPSINEFVYKDNDNVQLEHIDFMEAAVTIAIQQNGLTACSIQMSPKR